MYHVTLLPNTVFNYCRILRGLSTLKKMRQLRIGGYPYCLIKYNLLNISLDAVVVILHGLFHDALAGGFINEIIDNRDWLIGIGLSLHPIIVHDNLGMENLLVNALVEIVAYRSDKHTLR